MDYAMDTNTRSYIEELDIFSYILDESMWSRNEALA